ncbi:DNA polymerase III subunit gamma/tau [Labilibaculum euxinus]|uniref:DNA polymerase III subunit gamma/tau n=1 Tax=Labilibaculum euxinus TaxID=2686357 RepID=A0A7M4D5L2_9BACT|nr:DNA polymerase III subunit gamma/tau [Labilibaculum euxinus]MUP37941.1 DNA polymerase III subunit gamma/tau [Labilibaculum euxinus]MVB07146.1 DNA polymerase III subunit gamma/tau [Labilibaculum euxinus]
MENYIVSARKYRPSIFSSVVGQQSITVTLKNAIKNNHLAHAYLFCGPRGVGKTSCARIFAKTINCSNISSDFEACDTCESCVAFNENRSYNIHELDAASNNSVEDIRSLIDQVRIPPQIGSYSIYIIDEVHMLSASAFNAFLKTLEEPPAHAIFVLATTEKHKILPTILSRCQIFDFNRIKVEDSVKHLKEIAEKESVVIEEEGLNVIAQKADGAMRDALSIFDQIVSFSGKEISFESVIQNLNVLDYDYYFKMVDAFLDGKVSDVLLMLNEILEKGFDGHHFVAGLSAHIRDVLVGKDPATVQLLEVSDSVKQKYIEQSKKCPLDFLYEALKILNQCDIGFKASQNQRLLIELSLIQLSQIIELKKKGLELNLNKKKIQKIIVDGEAIGTVVKPVVTHNSNVQTIQTVNDTGGVYNGNKEKSNGVGVASKSNFASSVSIKQALNSGISRTNIASKPKDKKAVSTIESIVTGSEPITQEKLEAKLKEYIIVKGKSDRIRLAITVNKPKIVGDDCVVLMVSNPLQEDDVVSVKNEVRNYLRKELNNSDIQIETEIIQIKTAKRMYTDSDRFNYLCEKNPALGLLKQKFSLDFE